MRASILLLTFMTALSSCAEHDSALDLPPGTYQKTVKSTDANGVTTERNNTTSVGIDAYGRKTAIVDSKTTEKPPGFFNGLFNKSTTRSTEVIKEQ